MGRNTREHPMQKTQLGSWNRMQLGVFQECLEALIVCTEHGRTVHSRTKTCTKVIKDHVVWCLRLWQPWICEFGMLSLVCQDHTMTSTYCSIQMCSAVLLKVELLQCSSRSMATSMTRATTWQVASIEDDQHL
jgi:hypothetical protein